MQASGGTIDLSDLKRKVSRLRDWNTGVTEALGIGERRLETKSISITRLKHCGFISITSNSCVMLETKSISITRLKRLGLIETRIWWRNLKRKVSRLRDWNLHPTHPWDPPYYDLKRKVSRLRDWNLQRLCFRWQRYLRPWNEKYLDYEIETKFKGSETKTGDQVALETKSISITRLKHLLIFHTAHKLFLLKRKVSRLRDWNIGKDDRSLTISSWLETKSISITRLKQTWTPIGRGSVFDLKRKVSRLRDWNSSARYAAR